MKRLIVATSILAAVNANAASSSINAGPAMTLGPTSSMYSISSFNPAMNSLVIGKGERMRMGLFPTMGFNTELGQVDNFADDMEELAEILDDPSSTTDSADETRERFNGILESAGQDGYFKMNAQINAPLTPLYFYSKTLGGTIGLDYSITVQGSLSLLDDELVFNQQNGTFATNTALYLKSGVEQSLGLSYSRPVYSSNYGRLYAGAKLKYMTLDLSKQIIGLIELADSDMADLLTDEYDKNQLTTSDFGMDLGIVWDANRYRIGLTIENINSPEFDYGTVGQNCTDIAENTSSRSNCELANYFSDVLGEISSTETHTKHALMRVDALVKLTERLQLSAALDLAEYNDVTAYDHQWFHSSLSYDSDYFLLPSIRAGYHKNLTGTELSSINVGATLFKIVNFDVEYGLESIDIDGTEAPRRIGFSLSIQENF